MLRQTPPLEATEAFLAAARAPSFRIAAAAMALSPSAFSRRIQMLEAFLDAPLFDRSGSRAVLTETGRRYLGVIEPAVEAIRMASAEIRKPPSDSLRIATSHSLAVEWLVPRLGQARRELGLQVEPVIGRDPKMLRDQDVDLAIWGAIKPDVGGGEPLVTLEAVPVAAPVLADGRARPADLAELVACPLLEMRSPPELWAQWLYSAGYRGQVPRAAMTFETNQLSYEAAASGLGVALAVPLLVNRYLESGRLHVCAARSMPTGMAYWIHHASPATRRNDRVRSLVEWLKAQAAVSKAVFSSFASARENGSSGALG